MREILETFLFVMLVAGIVLGSCEVVRAVGKSKPAAYRDWQEVGPGTYARKTVIDGTTCILLTQDYRTELQCDWRSK